MFQGSRSQALFLIVDGVVRVHIERRGQEPLIIRVPAPTIMGEMAFVLGQRRSADVWAMTDVLAYRLPSSIRGLVTGGNPNSQDLATQTALARQAENARLSSSTR